MHSMFRGYNIIIGSCLGFHCLCTRVSVMDSMFRGYNIIIGSCLGFYCLCTSVCDALNVLRL